MVFIGVAVGLFWVGPRTQGRALDLDVEVRKPACVESVRIDLFQDRARVRMAEIRPDDEGRVAWSGRLPSDDYRLHVALQCEDLRAVPALERPLVLEAVDVQLPVTVTASCACADGVGS